MIRYTKLYTFQPIGAATHTEPASPHSRRAQLSPSGQELGEGWGVSKYMTLMLATIDICTPMCYLMGIG